jgi:hypothetical protein
MLTCATLTTLEARYSMEAIGDDPRFALVEIEVVFGERSLVYLPHLTLHVAEGQRFDLTVMAYDVGQEALWFQASGLLIEDERVLEYAA